MPAHRLEVGVAALDLLGDRVRVAEPALEGAVLEDRSGSGEAVDLLGDAGRLAHLYHYEPRLSGNSPRFRRFSRVTD